MTLEYIIQCHDYDYIKSHSISEVHMETFFNLLKSPKSNFHKFISKNFKYLNRNFHENNQYYLRVLEFYLMPKFFKYLMSDLKINVDRFNQIINNHSTNLLKSKMSSVGVMTPVSVMAGGSNNLMSTLLETNFDVGVKVFFLFTLIVFLYNRNLDNLFNPVPPKKTKKSNNRTGRRTRKANSKPTITILLNRYGKIDTKDAPRRALYIYGNQTQEYFIKIAPMRAYEIDGSIPYDNLSRKTIGDSYESLEIGKYLYEGRIYESLNQQVKNRSRSSMKNKVIEMHDYDLIDNPYLYNQVNKTNKSPVFNVSIDGKVIDINKIQIGNYTNLNIWSSLMKFFPGEKKFSFMVTECNPDFKTLSYRQDNKQLSKQNFRDIFKDGCETLKYMYKKFNFKHLDFHRENILTSMDGKVKLFDFDLSEIEHESGNQFISGLISGVYPLLDMDIVIKAITEITGKTPILDIDMLSHCYDIYRFIFDTNIGNNLNDADINKVLNEDEPPYAIYNKSQLRYPSFFDDNYDMASSYEFEKKIFEAYMLFIQ